MKVSVVEDYEDTRFMMRIRLARVGHQIVEAADGEEAVEIAWRGCPDVVLIRVFTAIM